jgi:Tol biopolymer transport system component
MKSKNLIIGLVCLLIMVVVLSMSTKSQKPEEPPKFETILIGNGGSQRWSPDGTKIAFMAGGWLCVANADGKGEIRKVTQIGINSLDWMDDSSFVFSEKRPWTPPGKGRGHKFIIETVDLKGQVQIIREDSLAPGNESDRQYVSYIGAPFVLKDGTVGYREHHEKPEGETTIFKIIKQGRLRPEESAKQLRAFEDPYPWGDIWVEHIDGTLKRKVTKGARKYGSPQLSPDNTKIVAHHYGLGISILDLNGNVLADFSKDLPKVEPERIADILGGNWSPDSKKIAFELVVESEDTTYSREIYIANFDGTDKIKIPDIPGERIGGPGWSPDGTKIVCKSESGKIYVIKVK